MTFHRQKTASPRESPFTSVRPGAKCRTNVAPLDGTPICRAARRRRSWPHSRSIKEEDHVGHRHRQRRPDARRRLQRCPGHASGTRSRQGRDRRGAQAGQGRGGRGVRGDPGPDPDGGPRPEPRPSGLDQRRRAEGGAGLRRQHPVRLGAEVGGFGLSGDPERRQQHRCRGRPGEHEPSAALRLPAQRRQDGQRPDA